MMTQRGIEVTTATAQMQVVGRRHYGRKALPSGGGGGRQASRELFDTLLLWNGRTRLDANGEATLRVPINDSLTAFRLVAVATAGADRYGTGQAVIRSTQDLMLLSGLPLQVREQDRFQAGLTVRNASTRPIEARITAAWRVTQSFENKPIAPASLPPVTVKLAPGRRCRCWDERAGQCAQARMDVQCNRRRCQRPHESHPGSGYRPCVCAPPGHAPATRETALICRSPFRPMPFQAVAESSLHLRAKLADELSGVREYMADYPYTCLEQRVSQAIALRDQARWRWPR